MLQLKTRRVLLPNTQRNIEELTGSCKRLDRQGLWEEEHKKIFFCTPQTFRNDVDRGQRSSYESQKVMQVILMSLSGYCHNISIWLSL